MNLNYHNNAFHFDCDISDNELPSRAGFAFDKSLNMWATPFASVAKKVAVFADENTKKLIDKKTKKEMERIRKSSAAQTYFKVPIPAGKSIRPYQRAGVEWIIYNDSIGVDTLLADQPGLGKTIQAVTACNILNPKTVLIICPASPKINWRREWLEWSLLKLDVGIVMGAEYPNTDVVIINYDLLSRHGDIIKSKTWDVVILDESHYLKNPKAVRTREVIGGRFLVTKNKEKKYMTKKPLMAKRKIALTGTPIPNRVIEGFTIFNYLLPLGFPNQFSYAKRYCAMFRDKFGRWDMSGSSNLEELGHKLRSTIMVRRRKEEVLHDLPPKVHQIIEVEPEKHTKKWLSNNQLLWDKLMESIGVKDEHNLTDDEYSEVVGRMTSCGSHGFEDISTIRKETGINMIPAAISHLQDCIESSGKVICFCWHEEVARSIKEAFEGDCVMIIGPTPLKARQKAVDDFQKDGDVKLFIGNIKAAGTAITLNAASHVVFVEYDYVPGNMEQASDRAHRFGQKSSVLVQYLVMAGSIAARMAKINVKKQKDIDKALDIPLSKELKRFLS